MLPVMLTLQRLQRISLTRRPAGQRAVAQLVLRPNYALAPVRIQLEGLERLPDEKVIFAMNHTDRYNYWPFQYSLYRQTDRFTATWVKGKYYETKFVAAFMEAMNNIPTVSRGYLITRDLVAAMGRRPTDEEYRALREHVDAGVALDEAMATELAPLLSQAHDMIGQPFDPAQGPWREAIDGLYRQMMRRFVELNDEAFETGLDVLVFPEGTRSLRLSQGRIGLSQLALHSKRTIVPVGCNGSHRAYPGSSPWAKKGDLVYRIGEPIPYEELADFHVDGGFQPFTEEAEAAHRERFQGLVDVVMERINGLLDEEHRWSEAGPAESDGVVGASRFV